MELYFGDDALKSEEDEELDETPEKPVDPLLEEDEDED